MLYRISFIETSFNSVSSTANSAIANVQEYKSFNIRKDLISTISIEEIVQELLVVLQEMIFQVIRMMVDGMAIEKSLELLDEFRSLVGETCI